MPHAYAADPRAANPAQPIAASKRVLVRREVILAGGAFSTPQLLKLSGIGPREELEAHGIPVRSTCPASARTSRTATRSGVVSELRGDRFTLLDGCSFAPPAGDGAGRPLLQPRGGTAKGAYTSNGAVRRDRCPGPTSSSSGCPARFEGYYPGYSATSTRQRERLHLGDPEGAHARTPPDR